MTFREFLESFDAANEITWESPFPSREGITHLGYFDVSSKTSPTKIRYRIRVFEEKAYGYQSFVRVYGITLPFGSKVARFAFGRWDDKTNRFIPTRPKENDEQPDERQVFGTLLKGYSDVVKKISPSLIYYDAFPDADLRDFQKRQSVYQLIAKKVGKNLGYTQLTSSGQTVMLVRNDLLPHAETPTA